MKRLFDEAITDSTHGSAKRVLFSKEEDNSETVNNNQLPTSIGSIKSGDKTIASDLIPSDTMDDRIENMKYFLQLLQLNDKKKFERGCINLVLGYFNKFLNGIDEVLSVHELTNNDKDDGQKIWHAEQVGKGGFGTVLKVTKRNPTTKQIDLIRAIKVISNSTMGLTEAINAAKMNHPNVVKVYNVLLIRNICCVEMEYMGNGSLRDLIKALALEDDEKKVKKEILVDIFNQGFKVTISTILKMLFQCCEVLLLMKQNGMVHSDMKPDNILIKNIDLTRNEIDIAICDFGFTLQNETIGKQFNGFTPKYKAPELDNTNFKPTFHTDLYSLGKTFEELILRYNDIENIEQINEIVQTLTLIDTEREMVKNREKAFYIIAINGILYYNINNSDIWINDVIIRPVVFKFKSNDGTYNTNILPTHDMIQVLDYEISPEYVNKDLFENKTFISLCLHNKSKFLPMIESSLRKDKEFILKVGKLDGNAFKFADILLQNDKEFVLQFISNNSNILEFIDKSFKKDREIILEIIKNNPNMFEYIDKSLKKDREFISAVIKNNSDIFKYIDKSFKKNRDLILEAIKNNPKIFYYIDESLKKDRDFVLEAIKNNSDIFKYIDKSFKKDREFILEIINSNPKIFRYIDESLKKDREFISSINKEFILESIKYNSDIFYFIDESLKKDREIILEAIKHDSDIFYKIDKSFKKDREIILEAIKQDSGIFQYICKSLQSLKEDKEFILIAIKNNPKTFYYIDESFKKDRDFVLEAIKNNSDIFQYIDGSCKKDREIILEAVKYNADIFRYIGKSLRKDRDFVLDLIMHNPDELKYVYYFPSKNATEVD